jgi:hypothetical protein
MRLMVEETWLLNSANPEEQCQLMGCSNRNAATCDGLDKTKQTIEIPFKNRMRYQLDGLNRDFGMNFTTFVPIWDAVLSLRPRNLPSTLKTCHWLCHSHRQRPTPWCQETVAALHRQPGPPNNSVGAHDSVQ